MIINANSLYIPLASQSVHCIITSPPYWGLRDYGTGKWKGGDSACDHLAPPRGGRNPETAMKQLSNAGTLNYQYYDTCGKCGAIRIDKQLGLESTIDAFIENMLVVGRELWRILRDDGTLWLNFGDSYAGGGRGGQSKEKRSENWQPTYGHPDWKNINIKPKDLIGMPWRIAFAFQADGWYLRSDVIWHKPNPMPESVTDRPTKAHEYLFLLTKERRYYYDADAIREPVKEASIKRVSYGIKTKGKTSDLVGDKYYKGQLNAMSRPDGSPKMQNNPAGRNKRSVWRIPTRPYKGAHFATFPPALVEPCVKAGTSEWGVCPICGKQWRRITKKGKPIFNAWSKNGTGNYNHNEKMPDPIDWDGGSTLKHSRTYTTTGFRPTCKHYDEDYLRDYPKARSARKRKQRDLSGDWYKRVRKRPGLENWKITHPIVFDPFAGSGTTLMVANQLGRYGVGLDLSFEYLYKLASKRLGYKAIKPKPKPEKKEEPEWINLSLFQNVDYDDK